MNEEIFKKVKDEFSNDKFIDIDPSNSTVSFAIQNGPIKEVGVNGTQIDNIGEVWLSIMKKFNDIFPCRENSIAITNIETALLFQMKRKMDREKRGVEGINKI